MLGRRPGLSHTTMRWLLISMMVINGVQLALLQGTINATMSLDLGQVWTFVALSLAALLLSAVLLTYAFTRGRGKGHHISINESHRGGAGTVSSDELSEEPRRTASHSPTTKGK